MGLRSRSISESLERRLCLSIESASPSVYLDTDTDLMSQSAATSSAADGTSAVVYSDRNSGTGKGNEVWLRRFLANGTATSAEQVNTTTAGAQMNVDVAVSSATDYAVVWQSEGQDGSGWGIYARVHNSLGWSPEFRVNGTTAGDQVSPAIAVIPGGDFAVTWVGRDDNSGNGQIYARRFDDTGALPDPERSISPGGAFAVTSPDIASAWNNSTGTVAITWVSSDINNAGQTDVAYRQYNPTLSAPLAAATTVNTDTTGDQAEPVIAPVAGSTTDFVVAFSDTASGGDARISYRRMNTGGTSYTQQEASQDSDGNRNRPRIASAGGITVIGWTQQPAGATYSSTVTRTYTAGLVALSNEVAESDGVNARTLLGLAVTGAATFRELSTLGEFPGYGVASTATYSNVLDVNGTSAADTVVVYDVDASTIRVTVNGASHSYDKRSYDHLHIELGDGNDKLIANDCSFWATVGGGAGNDTLTGTSAGDSLGGGDGDDSITAGLGNDYVMGNGGNDVVFGNDGDDTLVGGAGKDTMYGGEGKDRLSGSGSPDVLQGEGGDDRIYGDAGDDRVDGGGGKDRCYGGDGNDLLVGGSSNDRMYGDVGNDTLNGGTGNDLLDGGAGTDLVVRKEAGDTLISIE